MTKEEVREGWREKRGEQCAQTCDCVLAIVRCVRRVPISRTTEISSISEIGKVLSRLFFFFVTCFFFFFLRRRGMMV